MTVAASAAEALAALAAEWADVLVADIGMPGEDGYSLIRQVRGLDGGTELPAIALTAYAGEGTGGGRWTRASRSTSPSRSSRASCWPRS